MKKSKLLLSTLMALAMAGCSMGGQTSTTTTTKPSTTQQTSTKPSTTTSTKPSTTTSTKPSTTTSTKPSTTVSTPSTTTTTSSTPAAVDTTIKTTASVNISTLAEGDITTDVTEGAFTFVKNGDTTETSTKKAMTVAALAEEAQIELESGVKFTKVLKTQSASQTDATKLARVISFKTSGQGKVKVYAKSGKADEARKIGVYSADKKVQHDSVELTGTASYVELTFHYAGEYYITSSANISIYSIDVTVQDGVEDKTWAPPAVVTLSKALECNANDFAAGTYTQNISAGMFTVLADATKDSAGKDAGSVAIDGNSKTYEGVSYTQRIKTGGTGTKDHRSIKIELTGAARVTVVCMSSSSSANREANLYYYESADATEWKGVEETNSTISGAAIGGYDYLTAQGGTYYFASVSGGINIYNIIVEYLTAE